jgi:hypothetical protein
MKEFVLEVKHINSSSNGNNINSEDELEEGVAMHLEWLQCD